MRTVLHPRVEERGILTSIYKQEIYRNANTTRTQSLSRFKRRIKNNSLSFCCSLTTSIRVSLFFAAMVLIVF